MYSEIEIKVSDPCVSFCETVIDSSGLKCISETPNKANRFTMIAEPMDKGLVDDIEAEKVNLQSQTPDEVSKFFEEKYSWDILAAKSVWAFGPDNFGPNLIMDDTLPFETNKTHLEQVKSSLIHGFQWSTREGPLCEEPIRNVKYKLMGAELADQPIHRAGGQVIPTTRRVCYSSFLVANPRILEPNLLAEIICSGDCLDAVYTVLNRRRGHVITQQAKPGTPLYVVKANIPALDSFGFETDLRAHTTGQAFVLSVFDGWDLLPGDPLDKNITLNLLEPSEPSQLAREVVIKTRRRKGLNEDVSIIKYFDDQNIINILRSDNDYKNLI